MIRSIAAGIAVATAMPLLWTGCGEKPEAPAPLIRPVRTAPVYATGGGRVRSFSGSARAAVESRLSFKLPGTVKRLLVEVGDEVKAGQLIAELDDADYRLQAQEAEAGLASAEAAQAVNAEANYDRVQSLYENRNASKNDLDAARAGAISARQNVNSIAKRLELANATLGYTRLRAQLDGSIADVPVEANENVGAGQPVVLLTSRGRLEVEVTIPEQLIVEVREGDEVTVRFDAMSGRTFGAHVTEVGVVSGTATTYPVTVRLDKEDSDHRPGMAAEVDFRFGGRGERERIYVPSVAVGEDRQGERFVFVVSEDAAGTVHAQRREVVIGTLGDEGLMEIQDGLVDGELVVTAGVSRITHGQEVRLLPK